LHENDSAKVTSSLANVKNEGLSSQRRILCFSAILPDAGQLSGQLKMNERYDGCIAAEEEA
jgi:hypothetical protein